MLTRFSSRRAFSADPCCILPLVAVALVACRDVGPTRPEVELDPDIRGYVVEEAAAALGSDGHFHVSPDLSSRPQGPVTISALRASQLAAAFVKSYGPTVIAFWQRDRGASIDLGRLRIDPRVYPIESPYDTVPSIGCHPAFVRLFGPYYQVTFKDGGQAEVMIAVSGELTDFGVDGDGYLVEPPLIGMDFVHEGIPLSDASVLLISPEQAVAIVARATGAQIRSVPTLVLRGIDYSPTLALWRVETDRDITVVDENGARLHTKVLYVSPFRRHRFLIAADLQPRSTTTTCVKIDDRFEDAGTAPLTVVVRDGEAVDFEPVVIAR